MSNDTAAGGRAVRSTRYIRAAVIERADPKLLLRLGRMKVEALGLDGHSENV